MQDDQSTHVSEPLVDPDAFDLILQALAALSSIATLAASMVQIRAAESALRTGQNQEAFRQQTRQLDRAFDDLFEELRSALRIMEPAFERARCSTSGSASALWCPSRP
jgi:hypothetical protein